MPSLPPGATTRGMKIWPSWLILRSDDEGCKTPRDQAIRRKSRPTPASQQTARSKKPTTPDEDVEGLGDARLKRETAPGRARLLPDLTAGGFCPESALPITG
jgi:hypothetical protein